MSTLGDSYAIAMNAPRAQPAVPDKKKNAVDQELIMQSEKDGGHSTNGQVEALWLPFEVSSMEHIFRQPLPTTVSNNETLPSFDEAIGRIFETLTEAETEKELEDEENTDHDNAAQIVEDDQIIILDPTPLPPTVHTSTATGKHAPGSSLLVEEVMNDVISLFGGEKRSGGTTSSNLEPLEVFSSWNSTTNRNYVQEKANRKHSRSDSAHTWISLETEDEEEEKEEATPRPMKKHKWSQPVQQEQNQDSDNEEPKDVSFRAYQAEQWTQRFEELCVFTKQTGHSQVPHLYTENLPLARWVKRQRFQYKLRLENKSSTMTDERVNALEHIGFVWNSHVSAWSERYDELKVYKNVYGHTNVPSNFPENRQLAIWVKRQRRQYKLFVSGQCSSLTSERIAALERVGFEWELRNRDPKNC